MLLQDSESESENSTVEKSSTRTNESDGDERKKRDTGKETSSEDKRSFEDMFSARVMIHQALHLPSVRSSTRFALSLSVSLPFPRFQSYTINPHTHTATRSVFQVPMLHSTLILLLTKSPQQWLTRATDLPGNTSASHTYPTSTYNHT